MGEMQVVIHTLTTYICPEEGLESISTADIASHQSHHTFKKKQNTITVMLPKLVQQIETEDHRAQGSHTSLGHLTHLPMPFMCNLLMWPIDGEQGQCSL